MTQPPPGGWPPAQGWGPPQRPPGYPPPPPGYYPPPGYQPPPPGGYRPQPGWNPYGKPGAGDLVGEAFRWAWRQFKSDGGVLVVATIPYLVAYLALQVFQVFFGSYRAVFEKSFSSSTSIPSPSEQVADSLRGLPLSIVSVAVGFALMSLVIRAALVIIDGGRPTTQSAFSTERWGAVVLASLLTTLIAVVGFALCLLPGVIALLFLQFTFLFVLDQGHSVGQAMKASVLLVRHNLGASILVTLCVGLTYVVGVWTCCVGLLVAVPLGTLAHTYAYRRLQNAPIAH